MRSPLRAGALLALLLGLAVLLPTGPARAATVGVSLTVQGPSPAQASARAGDTVVFTNNDAVTHTVRASGGGWSFSQAVAPGSSASHPFPAAGTYRYTDTHQVGVLTSRSDAGSVVVAAPASQPTAPPPASPAPTRSAAPQPTPTRSAAPRATPPPTQSPGTATAPAVGALPVPVGGTVPTGSTPTPAPSPAVAPSLSAAGPAPGAVPQTGAPAGPAYAQGALTQGSAHRYGLPAALAVLALTGVVSLLVRLLLADPAAQAARRDPEPRG